MVELLMKQNQYLREQIAEQNKILEKAKLPNMLNIWLGVYEESNEESNKKRKWTESRRKAFLNKKYKKKPKPKLNWDEIWLKYETIYKKHTEKRGNRMGNASNIACRWLEDIMNQENIDIQYGMKEFSYDPDNHRFKADGYCKETNTIYEFQGCIWHGCVRCIDDHQAVNPVSKKKYCDLYNKTKIKEKRIKELGYNLITIWECEYKKINSKKYP